jgi:16S rRNA (uracil1498-N3)-methyltransferase
MAADMRRFYTDPKLIEKNTLRITDKQDIKHILKVLRMEVGDPVVISDGDKFDYEAQLKDFTATEVVFHIYCKRQIETESSYKLDLYQGLPKQGKMDLIVQKSVELGVHSIHPIHMKRSVPNLASLSSQKIERLSKISEESGKQSGRGIIPKVFPAVSFAEALRTADKYDLILFPYENEKSVSIKTVIKTAFSGASSKPVGSESKGDSCSANVEKIALFIGPEGGFESEEAETLIAHGAKVCTLGKTILRTETAGPAALAMLRYELEL